MTPVAAQQGDVLVGVSEEYRLELVRTVPEMQGLEAEWRELQAESSPRNPFLGFDWTLACWQDLCSRAVPFVLALRREGRLVGIAALCLERRYGFRVLRFIGDGRSDYLGFLCDPQVPGVESRLLEGLAQNRGRWDVALLRQLNEAYTGLARTALPGPVRSAGVEGTRAFHTAHAGDWTAVCAAGPSWLRRMPKELRRFEREGGTSERWTGEEAIAHIAEVSDIEARSWKGHSGVGRFQPGSGQRFLESLLRGRESSGDTELWIARIHGRPVAYALNLLGADRIMIYQGAYDPDFKRQGAGAVLQYLSIRRAWEAGAREYDYMNGEEPYKTDRTNSDRSIRYLALYPATPLGYAAFSLLVAPRWKLKGLKPAQIAHQWWVRCRASLALPFAAARRGT